MGVKDLWKLLEPAGRSVNIESLDGKILAIDVSIWLNQALKGARDQSGAALPHSHLLVLFHRLCKLLYYNIKPVIVFDGATAELKHQTLAVRRKRRHVAQTKSDAASTKLLWNYAKSKAMEEITGVPSSSSTANSKSTNNVGRSQAEDLYQLPPLSDEVLKEFESQDRQEEAVAINMNDLYKSYYEDLDQLDFNGDHFKSLSAEIQHELITARKLLDKNRSSVQLETLPTDATDFSSYQLSRLMQRSQLSKRLEDVRKSLSLAESSAMVELDPATCDVEVNRIASDETARYILIKNQPSSSGICRDDIVHMVHIEDQVNTDGDKLNTNSDKVDGSADKVAISDDTGDIGHSRVDSKCDTTINTVDTVSDTLRTNDDTPGTKSDKGVNISKDNMDTRNKMESNMTLHNNSNISTRDATTDVAILITDDNGDKPSNRREHTKSKIGVTVDTVEDTVVYDVDTNNDKVDINSDTVEVTNEKMDKTEYNSEVVTDNTIDTALTATDKQLDTYCDKTDAHCDKVDIQSDKVIVTDKKVKKLNADVDNVQLTVNKEYTSHLTTEEMTSEHTAMKPERTVMRPGVEHDDVVALSANTAHVSSEVEIMSSDSNSELEELAPLAKKVCSNGSSSRLDLLETVQQELSTASPLELQNVWELERVQLQSEQARQSRLAATVSNQVYEEAKELLSLFGVPYIISPCEAEAQCAQLDYTGQVSGTVTDDSDYFLFGGKQAFRSFFSTNRDIDCYKDEVIQQTLGLDRLQLINLAYLLGSDYTVGVAGVGVVTAMEVLKDFHGCGLEVLQKFKIWHKSRPPGSLDKNKLRSLTLDVNFPDERIQQAYLHPAVDESQEEFAWSVPDLDLLRQYTKEKFGWDKKRCDQELLPVIQRINQRKSKQRQIEDYTVPQLRGGNTPIRSRRLLKAVSRIKQHQGPPDTIAAPQAPQARTELVLSCSESSDEE